MASHHRHLGHSGNAGQRLPTEAQSRDGVQVIGFRHLAGGKTLESKLRFVVGDADAIIRHPNVLDSTAANLNRDFGGSSIQGVFHKLLDHRSGSLDDLARGNHGGNFFG